MKKVVLLVGLVFSLIMTGCLTEKTQTEEQVNVKRADGAISDVYFRGTANGWGATKMNQFNITQRMLVVKFGDSDNERFKFDIYADWSVNYGDNDSDGKLDMYGEDIKVEAGKTYRIVLETTNNTYTVTELESNGKATVSFNYNSRDVAKEDYVGTAVELIQNNQVAKTSNITLNDNGSIGVIFENLEVGNYEIKVDTIINNYIIKGNSSFTIEATNPNRYINVNLDAGLMQGNVVLKPYVTNNDSINLLNDDVIAYDATIEYNGQYVSRQMILDSGNGLVVNFDLDPGQYLLKIGKDWTEKFKYIGETEVTVTDKSVVITKDLAVTETLIDPNVDFTVNHENCKNTEIAGKEVSIYKDENLVKTVLIERKYYYSGLFYPIIKTDLKEAGTYKLALKEEINGKTYVGNGTITIEEEWGDAVGSFNVTCVETNGFEHNLDKVYYRGVSNGWNQGVMSLVADNVWGYVVFTSDEENQRFKFDLFGDWTENYGDTNLDGIADLFGEDIKLESSKSYDITFNELTKEYTVIETEFKSDYSLFFYLTGVNVPRDNLYGMEVELYEDGNLLSTTPITEQPEYYGVKPGIRYKDLVTGIYNAKMNVEFEGNLYKFDIEFEQSQEILIKSTNVEVEVSKLEDTNTTFLPTIINGEIRNDYLVDADVQVYKITGETEEYLGLFNVNEELKANVYLESGQYRAKIFHQTTDYKFQYSGEKLFEIVDETLNNEVVIELTEVLMKDNVVIIPVIDTEYSNDIIGSDVEIFNSNDELVETIEFKSYRVGSTEFQTKGILKIQAADTYKAVFSFEKDEILYNGEVTFELTEDWQDVNAEMVINVKSNKEFESTYEEVNFRGTANGWINSPMTLVADYTWEIEAVFGATSNERFKFDILGDWTLNFGDTDKDGICEEAGADILVTEGTYKITFNDKTKEYSLNSNVIKGNAVVNFLITNVTNPFEHMALGGVPVKVYKGESYTVHNIVTGGYGQGINPKITLENITLGEYRAVIDSATYTGELTFTITEEEPDFEGTCNVIKNEVIKSIYEKVHFRGTANGWAATEMELVSDYTWEIEATFGSTTNERFKFDINGDWTLNFGDTNEDGICEETGADIKVTEGTYKITFNDQTKEYTVEAM